ncbi:MAG: hypothetical protein U0893_14025 [Chloroflexota bacterium]
MRVEGPFLVLGALARSSCWWSPRVQRPGSTREPTFWLVSAVPTRTVAWALRPANQELLGWAWRRWEIEVCHRARPASASASWCWNPTATETVCLASLGLRRPGPRRHPRLGP